MKRIIFFLLMALPLMATAQSTLTPQEQLEQAQKQLEEAQKALEAAKANAQRAQEEAKAREEAAAKARAEAEAKAKAEAEAKAKADAEAMEKTAAIQKQIEEMKKETARLQQEAKEANSVEPAVEEPAKVQEAQPIINEEAQPATEAARPTAESKEKERQIKTRLTDEDDDNDADTRNSVYLAKNAVPVVNGKVEWTTVIKVPGKSADELFKMTEEYLKSLTSDKLELEGSKVAYTKPAQHNIVATVHEWLVFRSSALALDRTEFFYVLDATCSKGQVKLSMNRLRYKYDVQGKVENYKAEDWITDKEAVNKKRTRLYPISGKFRKKTIDRKNEIFETLAEALK